MKKEMKDKFVVCAVCASIFVAISLIFYTAICEYLVGSYFSSGVKSVQLLGDRDKGIGVKIFGGGEGNYISDAIGQVESAAGGTSVFSIESDNWQLAVLHARNINSVDVFNELYIEKIGIEKYKKYVFGRELDLTPRSEYPCYTMSVGDPDKDEGVIYKIAVIGVPESSREYRACLVEELAHAAFGIPDRVVRFNESIFNRNSIRGSKDELTWIDGVLLKALSDSLVRSGMSESDFRRVAYLGAWRWIL